MTPIEALYKELKSDLLAELKNSFMEEIQPKIKDLIRESILETKPIEDYLSFLILPDLLIEAGTVFEGSLCINFKGMNNNLV